MAFTLRLDSRTDRALSLLAAKYGARGLTKHELIRQLIMTHAEQDADIMSFLDAHERATAELASA